MSEQGFCAKCGTPMQEGSAFCAKCGCPRSYGTFQAANASPKRRRKLFALPVRSWQLGEWVLVAVCACVLFGITAALTNSNAPETAATATVKIGETGRLCHTHSDGSPAHVMVADSVESFTKVLEADSKKDAYGILELKEIGAVWGEDSGTKVLVLDSASNWGTMYVKVRILSGPHEARAGWTMEDTVCR